MTSAAVLERIELVDDDDHLDHITCCDDDTALCGVSVAGEPWSAEWNGQEDWCEFCVRVAMRERPCGEPNCPYLEV